MTVRPSREVTPVAQSGGENLRDGHKKEREAAEEQGLEHTWGNWERTRLISENCGKGLGGGGSSHPEGAVGKARSAWSATSQGAGRVRAQTGG